MQVTQIATKEAETIISEAKEKATSESQRILTTGDLNLKDVQTKINTSVS